MRKIVLLLMLFFTVYSAFSQADTSTYRFVDEMPVFKDSTGLASFHRYLNQHIDISDIRDSLISGRIIVQFCVDSTGNTTDIKIIKSLRADLEHAVIKAIEQSPRWMPGKKDGRPVKVLYTLPMDFDFQE